MKKASLILALPLVILLKTTMGYSQTVRIGEQVWTSKNLNVDKFRNGDPIPQAKTDAEWLEAFRNEQPAWCYYNDNPANGAKYGKLYNWYAVNDSRGLAPAGYHIPSDAEWTQLIYFLGSEAGKKMKSTSGWKSYTSGGPKTCPNCKDWNAEYRKKVPCHTCKDTRSVPAPTVTHSGNGTNSSGFSGLPGGYRNFYGSFHWIGTNGYLWGTSGYMNISIMASGDYHDNAVNIAQDIIYKGIKGYGKSVRCIKD